MATMRVENPKDAPRRPMQRVPFGGFTYKLEVQNKDPNFHYYWQKDVGDNLQRMLAAGYEFVTRRQAGRELPPELTNRDLSGGKESLDDRMCVHGGRDEYGKEYKLFLMRQPREFYEEDQAANARAADAVDQSIRRQAFGNSAVSPLKDGVKYGEVRLESKLEE